jgi:hypothetical protein
MEDGIFHVSWFRLNDLEMQSGVNKWSFFHTILMFYNYIVVKLTRLPIEEGICSVNWFSLKSLDIKSEHKWEIKPENKSVIICHLSWSFSDGSATYNVCKLARLPMDDGISPVNWL